MANLRGSSNSSNRFDNDELMKYYDTFEHCRIDGCTRPGEHFDHVEGRSGLYTNSLFNASPVCAYHNIEKHGAIHVHESKVQLIFKNMLNLQRQGYVPNDTDTNFINHYKSAQEALALL